MDLELQDRVVIVTGASKGIGLAVTKTLLAEGAKVVASSRSSTAELDALEGDVVHVAGDLMDPELPVELVATAVETFGGVDIVVNNAGGAPPGHPIPHGGFLDRDDADWRAVFEFNLFAAVRLCRAAMPLFVEKGSGTIVNITSVTGRQPASMNLDYAAAKAAMTNLTKALAEEFGPSGVRVNGVSPGPVLTAWWTDEGGAVDFIAEQSGSDRDTVVSTIAPEAMQLSIGRLVEPQEIADTVALLASPRSSGTSGSEFVVDGGHMKST